MSLPTLAFDGRSGAVPVNLDLLIAGRALVTANSGAGKSTLLRALLEQTQPRVQQIVLDPEGEFASLREKFPYVLAGGRDGDLPADPKTAKLLCRRLLELNASAVIDLYDLKLPERRKFVRVFLDELMHVPRSLWRPVIIALDEAHVFSPERGSGEAESTDAVITVATQGRKRGFALVAATQRLSKLHKDCAAELLNVLIGRTGLDVDMKRAGDILGFDKEARATLRTLQPGTWYAFGPAIGASPQLVRTPMPETSLPRAGEIAPPAPPAPEKVRALLGQLKELQREAEEEARTVDDLRAQNARLQRELRAAQRGVSIGNKMETPDPAAIERAVQRALAEQQRAHDRELAAARKDAEKYSRDVGRLFDRARTLAGQLTQALEQLPAPPEASGTSPEAKPATTSPRPVARPVAAPRPAAAPRARVERASGRGGSDEVGAPQQKILDALARLESLGLAQANRWTVAALTGYSATGGGFRNYLGSLRSSAFITYPNADDVALTDDGRAQANVPESPPTLDELHAEWFKVLGVDSPLGKITRYLVDAYPDAVTRAELAEATGYTPTGGGFRNYLGRLRTIGVLSYPDTESVAATTLMFPAGLR